MLPHELKAFQLVKSDSFLWLRTTKPESCLEDFKNDFRIILDFGESNGMNYILIEEFIPRPLTTIEIYELINFVKAYLNAKENYFPKIAAVNFEGNLDGTEDEFIESVALNAGLRTRRFADIEKAQEWFTIDE